LPGKGGYVRETPRAIKMVTPYAISLSLSVLRFTSPARRSQPGRRSSGEQREPSRGFWLILSIVVADGFVFERDCGEGSPPAIKMAPPYAICLSFSYQF